jgi:D-3-phosphoglycerate dehydrogenase
MSQHLSLPKDKIRFLLLEGVHQNAIDTLNAAGYTNIDYHKTALEGEALKEAIKDAHFIGIRSRTQLTEEIFEAANKLIAVGCFCIGTNQVDLKAAMSRGIPVFNAPYSNTRSLQNWFLLKQFYYFVVYLKNQKIHMQAVGTNLLLVLLKLVVKL